MSRSSPWMLAGFFAAGCLVVVGYARLTRVEPAVADPPRPIVTASTARKSIAPAAAPQNEPLPSPAEPDQVAPTQPAEPDNVLKQWIADAVSEDAGTRASAITALAEAPKDAALPVLKRVLTGGDPDVDRPLALGSLRTMALQQGDADGRIRDVLRQTVSHTDSETLASGAQSVLDEVEQRY